MAVVTDLLRIEKPKSPQGMQFTTVLGAGRSTFGLAFYDSVAAYVDFRRAASGDRGSMLDRVALWQLTFDRASELPPAVLDLWERHDLPVADENAFPMVIHLSSDRSIRRPGTRQLSFLEGLLRALASTTEAEIDSGRWQEQVSTFHGKKRFVISLPDLLDPPSHEEWMRRGFMPDRRAHERMFADMNRYFQQHPPADMEQMNEVANRLFSGRKIDQDVTVPTTEPERAQQLCFEAFGTHGRRRVQLARQAIEIYPDCADAYVILAEQAGTLEAELDLFSNRASSAESKRQSGGSLPIDAKASGTGPRSGGRTTVEGIRGGVG